MTIIAIDPGCNESAWLILNDGAPGEHGKGKNDDVLECVRRGFDPANLIAIEMIASYGMAVGKEIFDTCLWIGRFIEAWRSRGGRIQLVYRREVKLFLCETARANDSNIRAALIDRFGPGREVAIGTKSHPGPLHGIKADVWSALAVALTAEGKVTPAPLFRQAPEQKELEAKPF